MSLSSGLEIEKLMELKEYDNHFRVIVLDNPKTQLKGFIAIHIKNERVPSFGATRLWKYENELDGLRDALRLSRLMSYKASLAGLPCGGAKAVLLLPEHLKNREELLLSYAEAVNSLAGDFITGTDVGLSQDDLRLMKNSSKFFVGLNDNATEFTALGIYYSMETCLEFLTGASDLTGKTFSVQGLGKVGHALLSLLYPKAGKIYAADTDLEIAEKIKKEFPRVSVIKPSEIHKQQVDIFSPCALCHALNLQTVSELNCRMIVGCANNQLQDETIGDALFKQGILYTPDYAVNVGGLIAVFDEYEHQERDDKRVQNKVAGIKKTLSDILKRSRAENRAPNRVANEITEKILKDRVK